VSLLRLICTTSFRLTTIYLVVFALSIVILGIVIYFSVGREIVLQIDERVTEETTALRADLAANGLSQLIKDVRARSGAAAALAYRLEDSNGRLLAGNLPPANNANGRYSDGWVQLTKTEGEGADADVDWERALVTKLDGGVVLLVGDELTGVHEARRAVLVSFAWALVATIALGTFGGLVLSAAFLRRLDGMTKTAQGIIAGDLGQRIPVTRRDDDLARLATTFNQMLDRIGSLLEANKHVSNDIAHDLRSPLARVLRRLETARTHAVSLAEYEGAVDAAVSDINGILETFGALLRIGQIEAGARRGGFKNVDLALIAQDVAETFQPAADDEAKILTINLRTALPIAGDRELLTQLVVNLIDNAIRHTPVGSRIAVCSKRSGLSGQLIVVDSGLGVPAHEQKRIFERFYRVDRSRTTPGDGLGLSLVAAVAELHGAQVAAFDNKPGLKVVLDFPVAGSRRPTV
jgi:signal transduction histidine kinase